VSNTPRRTGSHAAKKSPSLKKRLPLIAAAVTALIALVVAVVVFSGSKSSKQAAGITTTTIPAVCPLTGAPSSTGTVPQRGALAFKIDNYPDARPQTGMDKADLIVEEPVEGIITRYVAVYQCQTASMVGPIRSARQIDIGILGQLANPPLAHFGGIPPVLANIVASGIPDIELGNSSSDFWRTTTRQAPYNAYSSTALVSALAPKNSTPPQPIFTYSALAPKHGTPVISANVDFSPYSNVTWKWSAKAGVWLRFYNATQADVLSTGVQNQASNVIVQTVNVTYGPWVENGLGSLEVQAKLYNTSGPVAIFRNGKEYVGTWSRASISSPTIYRSTTGQIIPMAPGRSWIELLPSTSSMSVTSSTAPSSSST